jgi:peptidoglycan hydrolase-like protein with peptidoglycan-binding domain
LQLRKLLGIALACWLVCGGFLEAKPASRTRKTTAAKAKSTSGRSAKATSTRGKAATSASRRSAKARAAASSRARRSAPPRQARPTPERYMEIQQALAEKGYYSGPVDGVWSASCVQALKRFQAEQNLNPDGKLGALSLIALGLGPKRDPLPPQFAAKPDSSPLQ